jgi:probable DNA metabolism protein
MKYSLLKLFSLFDKQNELLADLFGLEKEEFSSLQYDNTDIEIITEHYSGKLHSSLRAASRRLYEMSICAFDNCIHAWMSELPIDMKILNYGRAVLNAADSVTSSLKEKKIAADKAALDRRIEDTLTVLNAAGKTQHEIHRMYGLLRFVPDIRGVYTTRFAPDHFILPALNSYFSARFGEINWSIIDEKRGLVLNRLDGKTRITLFNEGNIENSDEWEQLWKHYHKTINNESRKNTRLQKQLMPARYWKYLSEVETSDKM